MFLTLSEENYKRFSDYLKNIDPSKSMLPGHKFIEDKNIILPILHPICMFRLIWKN